MSSNNHLLPSAWLAGRHRREDGFALGAGSVDRLLGGGLARGAIHEIYASTSKSAAASTSFCICVASRASRCKPVMWIRNAGPDTEHGDLHPYGLASLGCDPRAVFIAEARSMESILRASIEAARCAALGAVLIDIHGQSRFLDLTFSRRLAAAAERSGVPVIILRLLASPTPSAATTRWSVSPLPSAPRAANAPGRAAFLLTLLKHKGGIDGVQWEVEWNHETRSFENRAAKAAPLSGTVVAFAADRSGADGAKPLRRVG